MAEIELSVLVRQWMGRRLPSRAGLAGEVAAWAADRNRRATQMQWRFTAADARMKLKHLYPTLPS
jgi:hypothetical protein